MVDLEDEKTFLTQNFLVESVLDERDYGDVCGMVNVTISVHVIFFPVLLRLKVLLLAIKSIQPVKCKCIHKAKLTIIGKFQQILQL